MTAQNEVTKLLLQASTDLQKIYDKVIDELTRATKGSVSAVNPDELYSIAKACTPDEKKRVQALLDTYAKALLQLVKQGITRSVLLSSRTQQKAFSGYTRMQGKAVNEWRQNTANAFIDSRLKRMGGLSLSDRVWNYTQQTKAEFELAMSQALEKGISHGISAESLGRKIRNLLKYPDMMYRRYHLKKMMSDGTKKDVVEWRRRVIDKEGHVHFVKEDLAKVGTGVYRSARQNALRLTITETNMAYNYANCKRWSDEPFVLGINIRLSGGHPADDICDELEGDYPKDFMWRGWHPRCMCVCSSILMDRDSDEWKKLRSMSTEEYNAYKSPNNIKNVPQGFKTWCETHKEKLTKARKANKLPYFVRDNEKVVGKIVGWKEKKAATKKLTKREQTLENARKRHEARTDKEINDILMRWDERKYTDAQKENFQLLEDIWFIKREKSMTFEKANQGKGNIGYKKGGKEYRVNCQSSVVAHELRMRGFDVTAQPNWKLDDDPCKLSYGTWQCWNNQDGTPIKSPEPFAYKFGKSGNIIGVPYKEVIQQLNEHTQEVGRYHVSFQWKGEKYGHIVTMERKADGSTLWYDPQTGERDFFDKEYAKKIKLVRAYRVDNLVFNPEWNVVRPIAKENFETTFRKVVEIYNKAHGIEKNNGNISIGEEKEGLPKYQRMLDELLKDNTITIHPSRLKEATKSKNNFQKFQKEYEMCKVAEKNGIKIEMQAEGGKGYDVTFNGTEAELKSIHSDNNISDRFNHAKEEQGAKLILFELKGNKIESIKRHLLRYKDRNVELYYYVRGEDIIYKI